MGFIWVKTISSGSIVKEDGVTEIKDNTDWIKDNLACITHNSTARTTHNNTYNASVLNVDCGAWDSGHQSSYNSSENGTNYVSDDGFNNGIFG